VITVHADTSYDIILLYIARRIQLAIGTQYNILSCAHTVNIIYTRYMGYSLRISIYNMLYTGVHRKYHTY
jgi:hypothetical protein